MRCLRCGAENAAGTSHCSACGTRLAATCAACGTPNPPQQKFCGDCGAPLNRTGGPARYVSAQEYTPRHLAEKILTSRTALEGERKHVTVLFADMKGSLELLADRDPEEARTLLDPALETMMEAVHRYEGTVNQVMGDGIMAIFGAPLAHEDHAVRACYSALRMQDKIRELSAELRRTHGVAIQIRIGMNSGEVVVRSIGNDLRMDYTAIGQTTHLAGRLEQLATPGAIFVTGECLRLAEGFMEAKSLGPVPLKGLSAPIEIFELLAASPVRSRLQAAAARGLTPFVGRRLEMEGLHEALRRAAEGSGQVVAVVGQAGVGKSRLIHEFIHSPHARGWLVLESKSISYGRATPYLPLVDFLKGYLKVGDRDDARAIREKVTGKVVLLDQSLQDSIPAVLDLLGALPDDHQFRTLEPAQRQQLTARSVTNLMLSESAIQPVVMVFEDLHWHDMQTLELLRVLITSIRQSPILLLVSYRPKEREERLPHDVEPKTDGQPHYEKWGGRPHYHQLKLQPLAHESLEQLLRILLGDAPQLQPVKTFLVERTGGNPFFVEEIIRSLVETGVLAGTRGRYRLEQAFSSVEMPATVRAVLSARIDRLSPAQKRLLQEAAVIGKDVPFVLLQAIAEMPEAELRTRLAELQAAEYLYESRLFPELEYTFKHSLTREVAYSILLRERTKLLHARVAHELIRLAGSRLEEHVEQIAEHAEQGEVWPLAVDYLQRSGEKAFALYANAEAADYFDRALKALQRLPLGPASRVMAVDLTFELRNALIALSDLDRIRQCLGAIEPIVKEIGDEARSARLASFMCNHHFLAAEQARAIEVGEAGLEVASKVGDRRSQTELFYRLGQSYHLEGDNRKALQLIERSIELTAEPRERDQFELAIIPAVGSRIWLVSILAEQGEFARGMQHAERALELARQAQHPVSEVLGWLAVGHVALRRGELERATGALGRGVDLAEQYSLPMWRLRLISSLGVGFAHSGRAREGLQLARQALEGAETMSLKVDQPLFHVHVGEALLAEGDTSGAAEHARKALDIARQHGNLRDEPWARYLLARALSMLPGSNEQAIRELEAAVALATKCGARPLEAHCRALLGEMHRLAGRDVKANDYASSAREMYASLAMRPPHAHVQG